MSINQAYKNYINQLVAEKLFGLVIIGLCPVKAFYSNKRLEVSEYNTNMLWPCYVNPSATKEVLDNFKLDQESLDEGEYPTVHYFDIPYLWLEPIPDYCDDMELAREVELKVSSLSTGCCSSDHSEPYILALIETVVPSLSDGKYSRSNGCMNNIVYVEFRTNELVAIACATPLERCIAALKSKGIKVLRENEFVRDK